MIVEEGQNIIDIAIQEFGAFEAVFQLLQDNPHLENMNVVLEGSQEITIVDSSDLENVVVRAEFQKRNYKVRTDTQILNQTSMVFSKVYEFTTDVSETTKVLDFSQDLEANRSHLVQLYKDSGATYQAISLGVSNGTTNQGEDVVIFNPNLVINESDVTFSLSELESEVTYKIVVLQIEN